MGTESELIEEMKALVQATNGWLTNCDGNDDDYITEMQDAVTCVMEKALEIPSLRDWAARERDYVENRHLLAGSEPETA
jgi:hypothetical protein